MVSTNAINYYRTSITNTTVLGDNISVISNSVQYVNGSASASSAKYTVSFDANGGEDVSSQIRTEEAGNNASKVAAYPSVRQALLERQRQFLKEPGLVADGRDMGTVVFPRAQVKIFLDASAEVRAQRRCLQLQAKGQKACFEEIVKEIAERDERDRNRPVAPLVPASDALVIDTSAMSIEEVFKAAVDYIVEKTGLKIDL